MFDLQEKEDLIAKYGESYRTLIEDALAFLDRRESVWGVEVDRHKYIQGLVEKVKIRQE